MSSGGDTIWVRRRLTLATAATLQMPTTTTGYAGLRIPVAARIRGRNPVIVNTESDVSDRPDRATLSGRDALQLLYSSSD